MTKVKNLVTVTVENVFRSFPIDEERYELLGVVEQIVSNIKMFVPVDLDQVENERTKLFLSGVLENFNLGAESMLKRFAISEYPTAIPDIVFDRASRAAASMNQYDAEYDAGLSPRENVWMWAWCLWSNLLTALRDEHLDPVERFADDAANKQLYNLWLALRGAQSLKSL